MQNSTPIKRVEFIETLNTETTVINQVPGLEAVNFVEQRVILGNDAIFYIKMIEFDGKPPILPPFKLLKELGDSTPSRSVKQFAGMITSFGEIIDEYPSSDRDKFKAAIKQFFDYIVPSNILQTKLITHDDLFKIIMNSRSPKLRAFKKEFRKHMADFVTYGMVIRGVETKGMTIQEKDLWMNATKEQITTPVVKDYTQQYAEMDERRRLLIEKLGIVI